MIEIEKPKIECAELSEDGRYGRFIVEPLERGFGTTIGNALRRVLLSSLPGVAVTSIKIEGVEHEFFYDSRRQGRRYRDRDQSQKAQGQAAYGISEDAGINRYTYRMDVCAGDIAEDAEVEILDPDMHIASLDEGAELNMEITIERNRGYVSAERKQTAQPAHRRHSDGIPALRL